MSLNININIGLRLFYVDDMIFSNKHKQKVPYYSIVNGIWVLVSEPTEHMDYVEWENLY